MFYSLLTVAATWGQFIGEMEKLTKEQQDVLNTVFSVLSTILWVALAIVGVVGSIYAIYLGVQLSRAEEQGKRDEAKKHLITVVIAIGVTIALVLVFNIFVPMLLSAFNVGKIDYKPEENPTAMITPVLNIIKCRI